MITLNSSLSSSRKPQTSGVQRFAGHKKQSSSAIQPGVSQDVFFGGKKSEGRSHRLLNTIKEKLGINRNKKAENGQADKPESGELLGNADSPLNTDEIPGNADAPREIEEVLGQADAPSKIEEALGNADAPSDADEVLGFADAPHEGLPSKPSAREKSLRHKQLDDLIANNGNLDEPSHRLGKPILHDAAFMGEEDVVLKALAHGADINKRDNQGMTPLHWAVRGGEDDMARLLHRRGANHHIEDYHGNTPSGIPFDFKPERPTRSAFRDWVLSTDSRPCPDSNP